MVAFKWQPTERCMDLFIPFGGCFPAVHLQLSIYRCHFITFPRHIKTYAFRILSDLVGNVSDKSVKRAKSVHRIYSHFDFFFAPAHIVWPYQK